MKVSTFTATFFFMGSLLEVVIVCGNGLFGRRGADVFRTFPSR